MATNSHLFHQQFRTCVKNLAKDSERALGSLFDLAAMRLVRFATAITGNQSDAEDALQATFARIAGKPRLLMNADSPWPYLIRAVRNEALRILQKKRTKSIGDHDTQCGHETAEVAVYKEETAEQVQRALRALPKPQHEVIILKHWEGLTFAEISEVLGKSQNTVASRYRYAMEKLQRCLEPIVQAEDVPKDTNSNITRTKPIAR